MSPAVLYILVFPFKLAPFKLDVYSRKKALFQGSKKIGRVAKVKMKFDVALFLGSEKQGGLQKSRRNQEPSKMCNRKRLGLQKSNSFPQTGKNLVTELIDQK